MLYTGEFVLATSLNMMVFVDESGCDRRDAIRKFGYGLRGKSAKRQKLLVRGQHVSIIAAMTTECILEVKVVKGTVTGEIFLDFVKNLLLPHLIVLIILDNRSVHHISGVVKSLNQVGTIVRYLPPYSPDYNLIELLFSKVKSIMRAMEL